ncbi:tRNA (5-methylaminomethyl-2-thiouridine)(34)-methyltransferase MnmD [Flavobacterium rakeshii]|uniref:tRNA (5-methylaminomethyl-2-thiouridine)(34)-methyltransferase MnmD n=1 Tax=Flavobacterium rakeshii TaxID=1038845 RepID=UPI002E7B27A2|nr:tRNA (5-methylaminomethyl-2-thiouridine)(34)-methyltransferase MnmD [Flavobacterium rakeshii]MEE1898467.1 tRNA (5-methylaminomethyl-2-thiouridine)(34)-methyltransferase MnmD [Flavobacterium rakeshii]
MKREIIQTLDGSVTIHLPDMKESYHSKFGAIQEAYHVFIQNGLTLLQDRPVSVLEIGFGTGLNAFITFLESVKTGQKIKYTGVEAYPVEAEEVKLLNYVEQLEAQQYSSVFEAMHDAEWEKQVEINDKFTLLKRKQFFSEIEDVKLYDIVYFDAFGFHAQPELWTTEIFSKMYKALKPNSVLVTYACRTSIKKAMQEAGFTTEKLPGPPGKREMLRAFKY